LGAGEDTNPVQSVLTKNPQVERFKRLNEERQEDLSETGRTRERVTGNNDFDSRSLLSPKTSKLEKRGDGKKKDERIRHKQRRKLSRSHKSMEEVGTLPTKRTSHSERKRGRCENRDPEDGKGFERKGKSKWEQDREGVIPANFRPGKESERKKF